MVEKWSLGYWFVRPYIQFAFWLFHRKIEIIGKENIPENVPVIYSGNHPNALNDDLAVVCTARHQVVWLGRADMFRSAIARPFLKFMKIIPAYRIRDGKENLGQNDQTFATAVKVLMNNQAIGLYPEAAHSENRQMLPHKKAVSRIVFLAAEKSGFTLDTKIVPLGIYFDKLQKYGRRLLIIYGKPIDVKKYYTEYQAHPQQTILTLKNDLHQAILPLTLNYLTSGNFEGFEAVRMISSNYFLQKSGNKNSMFNQLRLSQKLVEKLDNLETGDPEQAAALAQKALAFIRKLKSLGLRPWLVDQKEEKSGKLVLHLLLLLLTTPLFIYGFLFNFIPFFALDTLVKTKIKQEIFRSTVGFALAVFVFPLAYVLEMLLVSPLLPFWYGKLLFLISLPFTGKLAFNWYIRLRKELGRARWLKIKWLKPELYQEIHRGKKEILESVD